MGVEAVEARANRAPETASPSPVIDLALRGLVTLGFATNDARRALDVVAGRRSAHAETRSVEDVLREAIAALT